MGLKKKIRYSKKVYEAINNNKPIIALESTIISHGMPYPQNISVAKELEKIAEKNNVVPATVCLMDGKIKIGLESEELEIIAKNSNIEKVSRRDFAKVLAKKQIGATTVAATMICSYMAGIKVFATGGIGGVHKNAQNSFDISADLLEFSQTPVIVVSAGAKAILDLPKTLEYLETLGVPVYGFKTDYFPAFYSSKTNLKIEQFDSPEDIAKIYKTSLRLKFKNGFLIANPIQKEHEIPFEKMEKLIFQAVLESEKQNITGKNVTPFLLSELVKQSNGETLKANIELVKNNVELACKIAKELY